MRSISASGRWLPRDAIAGVPQHLWLYNKADLVADALTDALPGGTDALAVSARTGLGLDQLRIVETGGSLYDSERQQ